MRVILMTSNLTKKDTKTRLRPLIKSFTVKVLAVSL
jgi:hypothetical protein